MLSPDTFRPLPPKNVASPLYALVRSLDQTAIPFDTIDAVLRRCGRMITTVFRQVTGISAPICADLQPHQEKAGLRKIALCLPLLVVAGLLGHPQEARAWADGGHKTIALIAWEKLTPSQRAWVESTLRGHPLFQPHFATPMLAELGDAPAPEQAQRWLFCQAAIWSDIVRPQRGSNKPNPGDDYHRSTWHYADLPVFSSEAARQAMPDRDVEPEFSWKPGAPAFLELKLNAVQVLKKAAYELGSSETPSGQRAVMLCWLFHVLGDVHQPCHTAQLFSPHVLPQGDRGGNSVAIEGLPGRPLHAYWDNLLGAPGTTYETATSQTRTLLAQQELMSEAAAKQEIVDPEIWLREGQALARLAVYPGPILQAVTALDQENRTGTALKIPLNLRISEADRAAYEAQAEKLATGRVVLAGLRLAQVIKAVAPKP